jgi:peroxiredoxin
MNGPEVGDKAPGFSLYDTDRERRTLDEYLGKNVVIAFYPGAFTSVCTKEMCAFRDSIARLEELDSGVAGISVNDPFTNAAFAQKNGINFPLLSDYSRETAAAYGVSLDDFAGMSGYTAAKRSIFIVDKQGTVRYKWVTEDQGVEPDYGEIQRVLAEIG